MKPFALHRWGYEERRSRLVKILCETVFQPSQNSEILALWHRGGGKALGLKICELISKRVTEISVPSWIDLTPTHQRHVNFARKRLEESEVLNRERDLIIRSSHVDEDWIVGEAGVFQSYRCRSERLEETLNENAVPGLPVVIQKWEQGIGLVIDVGWSELLQRVVVRIVTGRDYANPYREDAIQYSSATWDPEGVIVVLNPITGESIIRSQTGKIFKGSTVSNLPLARIATSLYKAIVECRINFGVQLEMIVHPLRPDVWHLVQIRPSTNMLRGLESRPKLEGSLVDCVGAVSSVFDAQGLVSCISAECQTALLGFETEDQFYLDAFARKHNLTGKAIALWEMQPAQDFGVFHLRKLRELGLQGQITPGPVLLNTTHSTVSKHGTSYLEMSSLVRKRCRVLGMHRNIHLELLEDLEDNLTLRMISDGLIGQVYKL